MKKMSEKEPLARELEEGLFDLYDLAKRLKPESRLAMPVCGVASIAIFETLHSLRIPNRLVISAPKMPEDPGLQHVFVVHESDQLWANLADAGGG